MFLIVTLIDFLTQSLMELPIFTIVVVALILAKEYFFLVALALTSIVLTVTIWLIPLCDRMKDDVVTLPPEKAELERMIREMCNKCGYEYKHVELIESGSGELTSNAQVINNRVQMSSNLLEHHDGHDDEIVAILAHELGHWEMNHVNKMLVFNSFYMMVYGLLLIPVLHNMPGFLMAFQFYHENYFMLAFLYTFLYIYSADIFMRFFINWLERKHEYEADAFSVQRGYKKAQYRALVRNFAQNKDIFFLSKINLIVNKSHPALLQRLAALEKDQKTTPIVRDRAI